MASAPTSIMAEAIPGFQRVFVDRRKQSILVWAVVSRFDHIYRLAVNSRAISGQLMYNSRSAMKFVSGEK
jgi:hypothetical protein